MLWLKHKTILIYLKADILLDTTERSELNLFLEQHPNSQIIILSPRPEYNQTDLFASSNQS